MTDFGKLLKSYEQSINAYIQLNQDRNLILYASMQLSIICGDILVELHEYKTKYSENDKYKVAMGRYNELRQLNREFDNIHMLNEKWRIAYKQLSDKFGSICSNLEHTEKRLERVEKEYRKLLLKQ